jgi:hypothetical protein
MNDIKIPQTEDSPGVEFDNTNKIFKIFGDSRPENPGIFYKNIFNWLKELEEEVIHQKQNTATISDYKIVFNYSYFNSTSAKYIAEMFKAIKTISDLGSLMNVEWHYDKRDDDMLDAGKEFGELFNLPINLIGY